MPQDVGLSREVSAFIGGLLMGVCPGCARLSEFLHNFSECRILWSLCSVVFHAFALKLPIQTPVFVVPELPSFFEFTGKISKFQENEHIPEVSRGSVSKWGPTSVGLPSGICLQGGLPGVCIWLGGGICIQKGSALKGVGQTPKTRKTGDTHPTWMLSSFSIILYYTHVLILCWMQHKCCVGNLHTSS